VSKRRAVLFAECEGKLYVKLQAVMSPLCALCDGLPLTFFGKGKTAYLDIDTAIDWCRKEKEHHSKEMYETMIAVMEKAKAQERT
jgi:hypothetical protein